MSVDETATIQNITSSLRDTLEKAGTINTADTIGPPLSITSFEGDLRRLERILVTPEDSVSKDSRFGVFEYAARSIFHSLVATYLDDGFFNSLCDFFDLLQLCADHAICEATLPLLLIEELLDGQTIDGCRRVFDYLDSRRERLVPQGFSQGIKLVVLRTCNELLRRLSRAEDAVFCGRVFLFLFQSFPLGDKSAVNLRGEFHTENVTVFDEMVGKSKQASDKMDVDAEVVKQEVQEAKAPPTGPAADMKTNVSSSVPATPAKIAQDSKETEPEMDMDTLYTAFWSLQRLFSDPRLAFADAELDTFKKGLEATLKKFKSVHKILQTRGTPRAPHEQQQRNNLKRKRSSSAAQDEFASNFNPKYLTNRDLFDLEISDLTFQRHILVQALIFLDFLLALTPQAKKRLAKLKVQKALSYDYTLSSENTEWAVKIRGAIADYLQEGPDGKYYYRMIDNVLSRDRNWVRWKVESCPPISLPPLDTKEYLNAKKGAKNFCKPRRIRASVLGAMDMSFISDTGNNEDGLAKLRANVKLAPADVKQYISAAKEVDLDMEMAKKEDKPELIEKRASNTWRVLRVTAKNRLSLFDEVDESGDLDLLDEEKMAAKKMEEEEAAAKAEAEAREASEAKEAEIEAQSIEEAVMKEDAEVDQQHDGNSTAEETPTTFSNDQQNIDERPTADERPGGDTEQLVTSHVVPPVVEVDGNFAAQILDIPEGGGMADVLSPGEEDGGVSLAEETTIEKEGEDVNMVV